MMTFKHCRLGEVLLAWVVTLYSVASALGGENRQPPEVSIVWPRDGLTLAAGFPIKIKADVSTNASTTVTQVQFFAERNLIGTVTNAPFNVVWVVDLPGVEFGSFDLRAVAVDSLGRLVESGRVRPYYSGTFPLFPVVEMLLPPNGSVLARPTTFLFSAEVLASEGDAGPVEFFVDDISVGVDPGSPSLGATTPAASVVVSNLVEGEHRLQVKYLGAAGGSCYCILMTNVIRIVQLEMLSPRLSPETRFQCEVAASLPGIKTIVEVSPDLLAWTPIATNQPPGTTFTFTDPAPATNAQAFYRVALPPP